MVQGQLMHASMGKEQLPQVPSGTITETRIEGQFLGHWRVADEVLLTGANIETPTNKLAFRLRSARGLAAVLCSSIAMAFGLLAASSATAQVNVTMQQFDIGRTGLNPAETTLTTTNVNPGQFGLLFSQPVVGPVRAQPLYVSGVMINGAVHNVLIVAT